MALPRRSAGSANKTRCSKNTEPAVPGETVTHRSLKDAAALWALDRGFQAVAQEIRIPRSGYRADAAACRTIKIRRSDERAIPFPCLTSVFECKQSRADFFKDSHQVAASLTRLKQLQERKSRLDRLLGTHYPTLSQGGELFPEYPAAIDPSSIGHKGYTQTLRQISIHQRRVFEGTKFDKVRRWAGADLFYLVVRKGILAAHEAPEGWGLLEWDDVTIDPAHGLPVLTLICEATLAGTTEDCRLELQAAIAQSSSRPWQKLRRQQADNDPATPASSD